ncbi:hypothetical protein ND861_12195 [Leptospira sp. 2 VSF19]|uniref:Lipoprotein n=1 Tax=Leptospira soteropolitanensis TaxID=2950025 RepID=A0AAW5VIP7_9LEPT|nr:hypothetical protein [Leptospira soteropolitanensis]MCW7493399.1 hypothetical protein [Leptospira soteropolitanensis]MCW7501069.1 hypothetical protein [Leptospira soteropolitanensis]MCW7523251.1 hypothetical protein [Leptospira soteropolitanensis]MCW7527112.1 hypothetical protein [Leptospira soteropolitanensis]MCW7530969.1 hypothetical protein [Leptospira soteropolitanensis]
MHRILLVATICLSLFGSLYCRNQNFLRKIELPQKEYPYTKRLPFIANFCDSNFIFQKDSIQNLELISIWDDGKF